MPTNLDFQFAFGYKEPKFTLWKITGESRRKFRKYDFPEINEDGLIHSIKRISQDSELLDRSIDDFTIGYHIKWTLHYNRFITIGTLTKLKEIFDYKNGVLANPGERFEIHFTPNKDNLSFTFNVYQSDDDIEIRRMRGGANASGSKGTILVFQTVQPVKAFPVSSPNDKILFFRHFVSKAA